MAIDDQHFLQLAEILRGEPGFVALRLTSSEEDDAAKVLFDRIAPHIIAATGRTEGWVVTAAATFDETHLPSREWYGQPVHVEFVREDGGGSFRAEFDQLMGWVGTHGRILGPGEGRDRYDDDEEDDRGDVAIAIDEAVSMLATHLEECTKAILIGMSEVCEAMQPGGRKASRGGNAAPWRSFFTKIVKTLEEELNTDEDDEEDDEEGGEGDG